LKSFYFLGAGLDPARLFGLGQNWSGPRFTGTVDVNCNSRSTVHYNSRSTVHLWTVELSWRRRRTRGRVADHLAWRWWLAWGGRPEASGGVGCLSWLEWLQLERGRKGNLQRGEEGESRECCYWKKVFGRWLMVEMMVSILLMVVVVAQGGAGGRNGDGVGFLWRRKKEEEAEEENLQREEGGRLVF